MPSGTTLQKWSGALRTSVRSAPTETVNGRTCKVFDSYAVDVSNGYLSVDDACVIFRRSRFSTSTRVPNSSALVQQVSSNELLIIEDSDFDGGPYHERGVQADHNDLIVRRSEFDRFGNAAIEMNNRNGSASLTVEDSYMAEVSGWQREAHTDGIQVGAGKNVLIRNNTVLIEIWGGMVGDTNYISNSALGLWAELGDVAGTVVIDHNLLAGGGRVIYIERKSPYRWMKNVSVVNNVFDRRYNKNSGLWGPLAPVGLPSDLTWSGNTFSDGTPISLNEAMTKYP